MTEHTPGKWFVDADESDFTVSSDHGQIIARCLDSGDFPCLDEEQWAHMDDEARANAILIAAAPDLFEAALRLEMAELAHANCEECDGEDIPEICEVCFPLFDDARVMRRNAIAKARGTALTPAVDRSE